MEPRCPYFGECGGCQTQHLPYDVQLKNKQERLSQLLNTEISTVHGEPYAYRNRMDFIFHPNGLGFRVKGNWRKILDIKNCPIADETVNKLLEELRVFFPQPDAFNLRSQKGMFRYAVVRSPAGGSAVTFILNEDAPNRLAAMELLERYAKKSAAANVLVGFTPAETDGSAAAEVVALKGKEWLTEEILGKKFVFHSQGFFQNNTPMAEKMAAHIKELLKDASGELLDLYGGVGLFGISCAAPFSNIRIVESVEPAITAAEKNLKRHAVAGEGHVLDAKKLKRLQFSKPLHVITDPPRQGMHKDALTQLLFLQPVSITYISCNPDQLAKELPSFLEAGYEIKDATMFDLFPQTNHIEAVVHFRKV